MKLRANGLPVRSVERAVTYDYASRPQDYEEILALRLRAHQYEGRFEGMTTADIASSFDSHARHLTGRFGGKIVGYVRVIFVGEDAAKNRYIQL